MDAQTFPSLSTNKEIQSFTTFFGFSENNDLNINIIKNFIF
jgi:hypothetical protein